MGRSIIAAIVGVAFALTACGQQTVVNRWLIAGQLKKGKLAPINKKNREYEFLKGGKFNIYENGTIKENGSYSYASDKKSLFLKIDEENVSLKIVKLTKDQFSFIVDIPISKDDTLVCYPSNSVAAKQIQQKRSNYTEVKKSWNEMNQLYSYRLGLFDNIFQLVKRTSGKEEALFTTTSSLIKSAYDISVGQKDLSEENVSNYLSIHEKISNSITEVQEYAKSVPGVTENALYKESLKMIADVDIKIQASREKFETSFGNYAGH